MSQITNLNVSPYFDDFDANNDYYRVLFKPGYPIQARELTSLQSILQNQIEKFGQHFFKEGAKVIPGNTAYTQLYQCVQLQNTYLGVPVDSYADQLVGTKITGQTSGVTAIVDKVLLSQDSERGNLTLYVNYIGSSTQNNSTEQFFNGEALITSTTITSGLLGNTLINAGQPFAITLSAASAATGSSFSISEGVYFVRGQFVNVKSETLILDQYDNVPNYRIGLYINEEIINSDIDESLNDNSQGFNNYASPGADRLKISVSLFKKSLTDFNDNNFVELATIREGILITQNTTTEYNIIADELARRTYAESGDYCVSPFNVSVKESLNDNLGNQGIFNTGQFTYGGSIPSENLAIYQISPGRAFVRGYDVDIISPTFLDVNKPRTTKLLENQSINYVTGPTLALNTVHGTPLIGIGNTYILSLRNERVGELIEVAPGKEIGLARVYDFRLESGSYETSNQNENQWIISLYDIQLFTEITLNESITLNVPTFVQGKNSGATAFIKDSVSNNNSIVLYDVNGTFINNESFIFDGIESGYVATAVTSHSISNVKSVFNSSGVGITFSANTLQTVNIDIGNVNISPVSPLGISTVSSSNINFPGNLVKVNDLVGYTDTSLSSPVYAKVVNVGLTSITVSGVSTVPGIVEGKLPSTSLEVNDFNILTTELAESIDDSLYTTLPKNNISSVDLTNANLTIRKSYTVNISSNKLSTPIIAGNNETFLPFDEERYSLVRSDGSFEVLTSDMFDFVDGGSQLQIYNLGSNDTGAILITTLRKFKPKEKIKRKNRVNSIIINKSKYEGSGIGETTFNDGLTYGNYAYGTRVQDKNICLNVPDIIEIHGVYESADTSNPSAPLMVLSSINGATNTTSDLVIGEEIFGQSGNAIGIVAEKLTDSQISFIYKNQNTFKEGETVSFRESNIQAVITSLDAPSFDISFNYTFLTGQFDTYYNYGSITRKSNAEQPNKKIKIYFSNGFYDSSDDGDITTASSYIGFDYENDIKTINSIRNTDIIDIRPRVSNYTTLENSRSPFEFYGRLFNSSGNSASNILASDESILTSFSFYLGRIDRIFLSKDGKFQVKYGTPSENPEKPIFVDDSLEIASIQLPPYLYSVSDASIEFLEYKRYRMSDIKQLENRIKNLEYYTSLSLLETNTSNLYVPDSSGLNRFKSGFFVDNFTTFLPQETDVEIKNSIDIANNELRPKHYTTSVDLITGPVQGVNVNDDLAFSSVQGINVRKTGDVVTLDYSEVEWLKQSFGTRTESVTPFLINYWKGTLELTPASDTWVDTVRIEPKTIEIEGNYTETLIELDADPQTGFAPVVWGSWVDNWTGQEQNITKKTRVEKLQKKNKSRKKSWEIYPYLGKNGKWRKRKRRKPTTTVVEDTTTETKDTGVSTRTGTRNVVSESFDTTSVGDRVVSRDLVTYMRSRNIQFVAKQLKPFTRIYAFFDGVDVTKYCIPKLLEINMISGVFEVGETVEGSFFEIASGTSGESVSPKITFRVAQVNHKEGPYNSPTKVFTENPYTNNVLETSYSSTSLILNVDTFSLSNEPQGSYSGWVGSGMFLSGKTSGAEAEITDVKLVTDLSATLIGSLFIPNPNTDIHPRFETGVALMTLINNNLNNENLATTSAEERFSSTGTVETVQDNILSVRNARVETSTVVETKVITKTNDTQVSPPSSPSPSPSYSYNPPPSPPAFDIRDYQGSNNTNNAVIGQTAINAAKAAGYSEAEINASIKATGTTTNSKGSAALNCTKDPLAQSFFINEDSGIFLTRCDVFFNSKDDELPVTAQLRTMQTGLPSESVIPFSEVVLSPDEVKISNDGSVPTSIIFKSPVYLEGGKEYCICLLSYSTNYSVYISRVGENDLITQAFVSNQPYLGSLFKSQNASTWEPSQWEDLKFTLYRADFIESGTLEIYNPELSEGNRQIAKLMPDSLNFISRRAKITLGSTISDSDLTLGNTILQDGTNAYGNYVGSAGSAFGPLNIINAGIGFTPSSGIQTYSGINLKTITGGGKGAVADVTISNGVAITANITSGGSGYQIGDVLGISSIGSFNVGRNARFSLSTLSNKNQIIVDNIQGNFQTGAGKPIKFVNNLGITTYLNKSSVLANEIIIENDGLHIKVDHKNHGMYSSNNLVKIYNAESNVKPTKLTTSLSSNSESSILIDDSSAFSTFENVGVGTTNPGYLLIGNEIIEYTSVAPGLITGNIVRGTNPQTYPAGTQVFKYELNGISLKRINKTHNLDDVTIQNPITFDSYYIKIDTSNDGINRTTGSSFPVLYSNQTKSLGGYNINATQNIPFEVVTPMVQNLTVRGTTLTAQMRTITSSSISGNEIPFVPTDFEPVTINSANYLDSPRMIASKVNESDKLIVLPGNKSMNMRLILGTTDTRISPVVDTQRISAILTSNRVNNIIDDYVNDPRANSISDDPTAFQYISKEISLENSSSSIKIILNASINLYSDIRAFYAIGDNPNFTPIFTPFPGYNNLDYRGQIINFESSDGLPDTFVSQSNSLGFTSNELEYREFTFTADQLPAFRSFRIKLLLTSTNQVYVPRVKDLRVIALA